MAKLKAADTKAIAQIVANNHKLKKVLKTRSTDKEFATHDLVPVKKVHVLMPAQAAFIDLNEEEEHRLADYAMEKDQSIHIFEHEEEVEVKERKKRD